MSLLDKALRVGEAKKYRGYEQRVARINDYEPEMELLEDDELRGAADELRERARNGESLDDLLYETFALVGEASKRTLGLRHFDVQLVGGMVLHDGAIAEMRTGEGKTLTATLPIVLNSFAGRGVHLVTVNDYLARRDAEWMGPIYEALGVSVGVLQNMQPYEEKRDAYAADVTYGTNSEFGFDYLRDNMAMSLEEKFQHGQRIAEDGKAVAMHHFAIVDEVDNILIDEARTPLIISGAPERAADIYVQFAKLAHQMVEAKEGVAIQEETQTLATITLQNYFRMYDKLAGMTGTALTEATEFMKIYELPVVQIPTNQPMVRRDNNDQIYKTKDGKWSAVAREIGARNERQQPVLVGTISVEDSELLSRELTKRGIKHTVLNAKPEHAEREGEIVAEAGQPGAVTIATNMAGRGVDIKLGGNPEHLTVLELRKLGLQPGDPDYEERFNEILPRMTERVERDHEVVLEAGGPYICGT